MPVAYHMVHYRSFDVETEPPHPGNLETLCRTALGVLDPGKIPLWERAQDRLFDLQDAAGRQILLNKVADLSSAVFGEMCLVQNGGFQALLELRATKMQLSNLTLAEVFGLNERTAPSGSQFVRGMAYWLAIGNHLFFVRTQAMQNDLVKGYLDWLLSVRTNTLHVDAKTTLQAEFDKTQLIGDIGDITSLRVSGKSAPQIVVKPTNDEATERSVATSRTIADKSYLFEQARDVAAAIFGKPKTDELVASLGPKEYLAVDASVKVRGRRTEQSKAKMKALANEMADMTEGKVQVEGKDGKVSDDDAILRTRMPFSLAQEASSFLEFDNVADQLQEVYSRFVKDGKIVA